MHTNLKKHSLMVASAVALLTACGGGGGSTTVAVMQPDPGLIAGTDLPVAVQQGSAALLAFAQTQLAATSDKTDPLVVGEAKLATDDAAEPSAI